MTAPVVGIVLAHLEPGGAERQGVLLARALRDSGCGVVVLVFENHGPLRAPLDAAGIPVVDLHARLGAGALTPRGITSLAGVAMRLRRATRLYGITVLQSLLFWQNVVVAPAALLCPTVRVVVAGRRNTGEFKDRRRVYQWIENATNPLCDAIVCNSAGVLEDLRRRERFAAGRAVVIANGVDLAAIDAAPRRDLRAAHPTLGGAGLILGTVGNLKRQKRHDRFLEALALLRRDRPDACGVIVGRDLGEESALRALAAQLGLQEAVVFAGGLDDPIPTLKGFDVFALTSDHEGMPNALIEAMAAGVPVVSTAVAGVAEVTADGAVGEVVEPTPAAIAAGVERALAAGGARTAAARAHVAAAFGPAAMAAAYRQLYARLAG
jgi:glycosyltransferase involved in cell wall biosynthesis